MPLQNHFRHSFEATQNHKENIKNVKSKRKKCDICAKQFNKETTFMTHMKKVHEGNILNNQNKKQE